LIDIRDFQPLLNQNWISIFRSYFRDNLDGHFSVHVSKFIQNHTFIKNLLDNCENSLEKIHEILLQIVPTSSTTGKLSSYHNKRLNFLTECTEFSDNIY